MGAGAGETDSKEAPGDDDTGDFSSFICDRE